MYLVKEKNSELKEFIKATVDESSWGLFYEGIDLAKIDGDKLVFSGSSFLKEMSNDKEFLNKIQEAVFNIFGQEYKIEFTFNNKKSNEKKEEVDLQFQTQPEIVKPIIEEKPQSENFYNQKLNREMNFDNFIISENNEFAAKLGLAIAKNPGNIYNPLLIIGDVGLGKTHLLHAIGNKIKDDFPDKKIVITSAEDFANEFKSKVIFTTKGEKKYQNYNPAQAFKKKYRNTDVLLIDDIHFLQGKEQFQQELFYTFNSLSDNNKTLIFTCDRPISELRNFEDRLRSRISKGAVAPLDPPKLETRIKLLELFLKRLNKKNPNIVISEEIINFIAKNVVSNIRSLEGAMNTVFGYSEIIEKNITLDKAKELISKIQLKTEDDNISVDKIATAVSTYYNISLNDLSSNKRNKSIVLYRDIAIYIINKKTDLSLTEIGHYFNRNHSTISHSLEKMEEKVKVDEKLSNNINLIINNIEKNRL